MTEMFSFRKRLEIAPGARLPFEGKYAVLHDGNGIVVQIRSLEDKPIVDSSTLAVWGAGFDSEASARAAGDVWRSRV